jgi:hypothetical protein
MRPLGAVLVRRRPDGEIRTGIPFHGRGTVKVDGALWQYVRSDAAVLAAERLPQFKGAIGHYDLPAARAVVQAQLTCERGPAILDGNGKALTGLLDTLTRALGSDPSDLGQQPVGFGRGSPPPTIDARFLHLAAPFVGAEEAFTLATVDDRALRFDSRRVRLVVAQLGGPPVLVVGGDLPPDGVEIDCDRLMADRAYALAMARRFAREVEANVRRDLLRQGPPHLALAAAAAVADEYGAREDAMALREIARACDVHQIAWTEIDAGRALS